MNPDIAGLRAIAEAALDCHQMVECDPRDVLRLLDLAEKAGADPVREELLAALKDMLALHEPHHNHPVHAAAREVVAKAQSNGG